MTHDLKTWPEYFEAVRGGFKPFEVRKNDRDYKVGDTLRLCEWDPETQRATGRVITRQVTYVCRGGQFGIAPDHCVLGIK